MKKALFACLVVLAVLRVFIVYAALTPSALYIQTQDWAYEAFSWMDSPWLMVDCI